MRKCCTLLLCAISYVHLYVGFVTAIGCFRKRRAQKRSPVLVAMPVLDLGEDETSRKGIDSWV